MGALLSRYRPVPHWRTTLTEDEERTLNEEITRIPGPDMTDRVRSVKDGVGHVVTSLLHTMNGSIDFNYFEGRCGFVNCGSLSRGTNIRTDEIDVVLEWEVREKDRLKSSLYKIIFQRVKSQRYCHSRFIEDIEDPEVLSWVEEVSARYRAALVRALPTMTLPPGWRHGGINSPEYSGYRNNGPALVIQLIDESGILINVDLVLAVPVEIDHKSAQFHQRESRFKLLTVQECLNKMWLVVTHSSTTLGKFTMRISYTPAENAWFSKFKYGSKLKTVIRILKSLNKAEIEKNDINLPLDYRSLTDVVALLKRDENDHKRNIDFLERDEVTVKSLQLLDIANSNELKCLRNLEEIYKPLQYISSYAIESVVLLVFRIYTKSRRRVNNLHTLWADVDISRIVVTVLDIMLVCLIAKQKTALLDTKYEMKLRIKLGKHICRSVDIPKLLCDPVFQIDSLIFHLKKMLWFLGHIVNRRTDVDVVPVDFYRINRPKRRSTKQVSVSYRCTLLEKTLSQPRFTKSSFSSSQPRFTKASTSSSRPRFTKASTSSS